MKPALAGFTQVLLVNVNGTYYAIGNKCTHMECLLSNGVLKGNQVTCACHASTFDVKTGKVLQGPAFTPEPPFSVVVREGKVFVDIPDSK
jgi:nitrite reductase/ring-hydroxylating ferredoxin subunit